MTTLYLKDLEKSYSNRQVVNSVSLNVKSGEVVGLLGPNGAGKTTIFYMIVGLINPDKEKISFKGNNITNEPMFKRSRMGIGYLPQEASIFRRLTVEENLLAVLEMTNLDKEERFKKYIS